MIALRAVPVDSGAMSSIAGELRTLAERPLFEPLAAAMRGLHSVDIDALNESVARMASCTTAVGRPVRFVPPDDDPIAYEARVYERGEVLTRTANWHDLFNALVWLRFPRAKAALNAVHAREIRSQPNSFVRSPRRDAATQFDESGLVVLSADPELLDLLSARRWVELFWARRAEVVRGMRFLAFGHGLYDALRSPFYGLCGRAALIEVDDEVIGAPIDAQLALADQVLAERFLRLDVYPRAKCFAPLPMLGIPGVTPESDSKAYYQDPGQFRPITQ